MAYVLKSLSQNEVTYNNARNKYPKIITLAFHEWNVTQLLPNA